MIMIADGYGVRLHHRSRRGTINIDIIYEPGADAYRIEAYRIVGLNVKQIARYENVYFMELEDVIAKILGDTYGA
jgi:succinate dehydrogenase flavin-adding protein (antitoxin of CptAB toxin-antitoxin module)